MKNFRQLILLFALLALNIINVGCTRQKTYRIGVSQCSRDDWRNKMNDEIYREIMFHPDAEVEIRSADDDNDTQIADIQYFADNNFDIIIVAPNEASALTPIIGRVYENGTPVIIFDRNINDDTYTARVGVDDEGIGRAAAQYAVSLAGPEARALEICGLPGSTPAQGRHNGFAESFEALGGTIAESVAANWNREDAVSAVDTLLRKHPDVNLIYAHNDRMAIGASEVVRRLGRRNDVSIIGVDAAPEIGIRAVSDTVIDATFLYPTDGHRLVRLALDILHGAPYPRETILPVSSAVDLSNADILLLQNAALTDETAKMRQLKAQVDTFWQRHSAQTMLFYASIVIIVLLCGVVFLILRGFWQHKRLNERLREVMQGRLTFFTNVSHDLRTPLTLIAEPVAQLSAAGNLTPQQHTLMKLAHKNILILRRLINQILDFGKYENSRLPYNPSEVNLSGAIAEWTDAFRALAVKRNIELTFDDTATPLPESMGADAPKIERVFFNLMSNAFKYTPDGGKISVDCRMDDNGRFAFSVSDNGSGISKNDLGNIFERFFQADRIHPEGSGIGLAVCKAFVELHGGEISVESAPGKGTRFTVKLPVTHVAGTVEAAVSVPDSRDVEDELGTVEAETVPEPDKPLVLVIDDNADILRLVRELMAEDYNVITAQDGNAGIRKAVKYVPDLIICDVMMPVMDGLECCRGLKAEIITSHIPVLMLTACSMDEQRIQGYDSGADGYMSKPFSRDLLLSRCAALIANRKRITDLLKGPGRELPQQAPVKSAAAAGDLDSDFYNRFIELFNARMGEAELSVEVLAAEMGMERTQLYRKIKALTGMAPVELMRKLRLGHARELVKRTEKSISEVAYATGFSTPAYFTRCYREAFGETPSQTRNSIKAG